MIRRLGIVVLGGLVVGVIDLAFAIGFWNLGYDASPVRILHSIAAGLLGKASYSGGAATAVLGACCHFVIAIGMGLAYYVVARRVTALVRHPIPLGLAYGVVLYGVMNFVVLPVSAAGAPKFDNHAWVASSIAMHAVFGAIFALFARRALR